MKLTPETGAAIKAQVRAIFEARDRILTLAGFTRTEYNAQWKREGERFWPDEAIRVAEAEALEALGENPNHGRMP